MQTFWQMGLSNALLAAVLAVAAAAAAARFARRPALAHALWLLVLLKLVTPPVVALPDSWVAFRIADRPLEEAPSPVALEEAEEADAAAPILVETLLLEAPSVPEPAAYAFTIGDWIPLLVALWLGGSLAWFAWVVLHIWYFQRLLRFARPAPAEVQGRVNDLARRLGLRRSPALSLVPGAISPMVWGFAPRPRLLFPAGLLQRLDQRQQATLFVHELAHVRRGDRWVRLVELLATGLYWWHPVLWWARCEIHEAEEQCCDAWVVGVLNGAGRAYALALLQTVAFFSRSRLWLPVAASGIGTVVHLRRRLTMIMQGTTPRSMSWLGWTAVAGLALFLLPLCTSVMGQQPAPPRQEAPRDEKRRDADPRDQQIQDLRRALEKLVNEQQREPKRDERRSVEPPRGRGDARPETEELQKARAMLEDLGRQLEAKQREIRELQAKFEEARARMAQLAGRGASDGREEGGRAPLRVRIREEVERRTKPDERGAAQPGQDPARVRSLRREEIKRETRPEGRGGPAPQQDDQGRRAQEVERKLERLLQEIENLRRELHPDGVRRTERREPVAPNQTFAPPARRQ
jgi:beta-lactamase regulating signal transducer with metallopeptidase domain